MWIDHVHIYNLQGESWCKTRCIGRWVRFEISKITLEEIILEFIFSSLNHRYRGVHKNHGSQMVIRFINWTKKMDTQSLNCKIYGATLAHVFGNWYIVVIVCRQTSYSWFRELPRLPVSQDMGSYTQRPPIGTPYKQGNPNSASPAQFNGPKAICQHSSGTNLKHYITQLKLLWPSKRSRSCNSR